MSSKSRVGAQDWAEYVSGQVSSYCVKSMMHATNTDINESDLIECMVLTHQFNAYPELWPTFGYLIINVIW